jgi:hypothetical protein
MLTENDQKDRLVKGRYRGDLRITDKCRRLQIRFNPI